MGIEKLYPTIGAGIALVVIILIVVVKSKEEHWTWKNSNPSFIEMASKIALSSVNLGKEIILKAKNECKESDRECRYEISDDMNLVMKRGRDENKSITTTLSLRNKAVDSKSFENFMNTCRVVMMATLPDEDIYNTKFMRKLNEMASSYDGGGFIYSLGGLILSGNMEKSDDEMKYSCKVSTDF